MESRTQMGRRYLKALRCSSLLFKVYVSKKQIDKHVHPVLILIL